MIGCQAGDVQGDSCRTCLKSAYGGGGQPWDSRLTSGTFTATEARAGCQCGFQVLKGQEVGVCREDQGGSQAATLC